MKNIFAPGCALLLYKPCLAEKPHDFLNWRGELDRFIAAHRDYETRSV